MNKDSSTTRNTVPSKHQTPKDTKTTKKENAWKPKIRRTETKKEKGKNIEVTKIEAMKEEAMKEEIKKEKEKNIEGTKIETTKEEKRKIGMKLNFFMFV